MSCFEENEQLCWSMLVYVGHYVAMLVSSSKGAESVESWCLTDSLLYCLVIFRVCGHLVQPGPKVAIRNLENQMISNIQHSAAHLQDLIGRSLTLLWVIRPRKDPLDDPWLWTEMKHESWQEQTVTL